MPASSQPNPKYLTFPALPAGRTPGVVGALFDTFLTRFRTDFQPFFDHLSELAEGFVWNKKCFWHLVPCAIGRGPPFIAFLRFLANSDRQAHFPERNMRKTNFLKVPV